MKICPFCFEEIQDNAIKCRHCKSLLSKEKKNLKDYKKIVIFAIILGVSSVFFGSIGAIPLSGLVVGIIGLIRIKRMNINYKVLIIIGFVISLIYSLVFIVAYSSIGPKIMTKNKEKSGYTKISGMETNWNGWANQRVVSWWFNGEGLDSNSINSYEWNCYRNCNFVVKNNKTKEILFVSDMPTQNGCDSWYNVPQQYNSKFDNIKSFCVQIDCGNNKKSDDFCWEKNGQ